MVGILGVLRFTHGSEACSWQCPQQTPHDGWRHHLRCIIVGEMRVLVPVFAFTQRNRAGAVAIIASRLAAFVEATLLAHKCRGCLVSLLALGPPFACIVGPRLAVLNCKMKIRATSYEGNEL